MTKQVIQDSLTKAHEKVVVPLVDFILGRTMSKKLTVFIVGTVGWFKGMLSGTEWLILSGIYVFGLLYLNHMENMAKFKKEVGEATGWKSYSSYFERRGKQEGQDEGVEH